ncbi:ParB/RepB/Spo0J family partition protein [Roseiconus nitratireducens]|uniref:ParB/RepB/Spo0J family partition protein n=1 Tax=Roseiconus nitratireducens TaxID=2605748 RepID=A0A5M6CZT4_9BACT|nr:ParB/RepB/Spo0J family partition protein [Roseiconus nitratireducens]KAA5538799.1 ParB/RepB/Spo0J family partition protein [Roseiconus nitratireducens]
MAAGNAFTSKPALPSSLSPIAPTSKPDQRRLSGAFMISLERIEPDPDQPRKQVEPSHIEELAQSIAALGVLQPITVREVPGADRYRIVAGECRYRAAKQAGLTEIPAWIRTPEQKKVLLEQVVENWQRSDLSPFEIADSLGILRDANGYSQQELANITGKSKGEISRILRLLELDPEVQQVARQDASGRIARRHLYAMRDLPVSEQLELLHEIQQGHHTTESVEQRAQRKSTPLPPKNKARRRTEKFRTTHALITMQFEDDSPTVEMMLDALHEVKQRLLDK